MSALKFARHDFLAEPLSEHLFNLLVRRGDFLFDAIVPVPIHPRRLRERGYNQAERIARPLARHTGIPLTTSLLAKVLDNERQSTLPRADRRANVRRAFRAQSCAGLSVLLVDDISTTGETIRACATTLARAGARKIAALTVARA